MAITPVPPLTDIPTFPALSDRAAGDYNGMAFAFARHMSDKFVQEIVPVAASAVSNATDAQASALLATQAREQTQLDRAATSEDRGAAVAARDQAATARDQAVAAAAQAGTTAAFTDTNPIVKSANDPTKQLKISLAALTSGVTRTQAAQDKDGVQALLSDIDRRSDTYAVAVGNTLDFAAAGYVRYAPTVGQAATIVFANFSSAAAGTQDSFRAVVIEGFRLGSATLTWPTVNWIRPDGSLTTNIALAGFTLSTSGIDFIILFRRANDATIYAKAIR